MENTVKSLNLCKALGPDRFMQHFSNTLGRLSRLTFPIKLLTYLLKLRKLLPLITLCCIWFQRRTNQRFMLIWDLLIYAMSCINFCQSSFLFGSNISFLELYLKHKVVLLWEGALRIMLLSCWKLCTPFYLMMLDLLVCIINGH